MQATDNLISSTHCGTPRYEAQIAPALWVLKVHIAQWVRTGCCSYWMKAKARGRMLLQKVILIDKAPCGLAVDC